jgi:hypothetical protein
MSVCFLKKEIQKENSVCSFVRQGKSTNRHGKWPSLSLSRSLHFFFVYMQNNKPFSFFFLLPICHSNKMRRTIELLIGFKLPGHVNKHSLYIREYVEVKIIRLSHIIHISMMMMMIMFSLFFRL